ncbi:MAG: prenyltransferase/squalene oxidase repeat-containing protein [Planctomycetota bacterium]
MSKTSSLFLSGLLLAPLTTAQHDGPSPQVARKHGTIYKQQVDGLIGALRASARRGEAGAPAPGVLGSDVLSTAKILVAMGHCHRRYHVSDGPVVRPSLDFLLQNRRSDGGFGDASTTRWVVDAMAVIDPDSLAEDIQACERMLAGKQLDVVPFDGRVDAVLAGVRADRFPQHMADDAARLADGWIQAPGTIDRAAAADALCALAACQRANRALDQQGRAPADAPWSASQERAFAWLFGQQSGGVFSVTMPMKDDAGETVMRSFPDPAFTGFGLMALQSKPAAKRTAAEQDVIDRGLTWLLTQQNDDGTFGQQVTNYTTCVVVGALSRWPSPAKAPALKRAQKAILMFQNTESGGYSPGDRDYGSIGYGNSQRGDLSNLHFSLEALRETGLPEDHEALKKAIVFLQRTQNLKSSNDFSGRVPHPEREGETLEVVSGDDGGASYYPGNSNAGYTVNPDGTAIARSYGSMTYALLKSYTLAGVKGDDPRVKAAVKWIQDNWTLAVNPGSDPAMGEKVKYAGLYYYYMVLGQALDAAGVETVDVTGEDGAVTKVDWRQALRDHLASIQQPDGTWINGKNGRWMENLPLLCTCYAMAALERCK